MPQFAVKHKHHTPRPELHLQPEPGVVRPSGKPYHQPDAVQHGSDIINTIDAVLEQNTVAIEQQPEDPTTTAYLSYTALDQSVSVSGIKHEQYARSLATVRRLGKFAFQKCLKSFEGLGVRTNAKKDWDSTLTEMIKTDAELFGKLEINRVDSLPIKDGKVTNDEGVPMTEVIAKSIAKVREAAQEDWRMTTQLRRDQADLYNAQRVDEMAAGKTTHNTRLVVSIEPVEAMQRDGVAYWTNGEKGFYYIKGMAFIQLYHFDGKKMVTGSFSVDMSDPHAWRQLLAKHGLRIPAGETTDTWVKHGLELNLTTAQALTLPRQLREQYYQQRGCKKQRHSVDEIMALHQAQLDRDFDQLYVPMAQAAYERKKNEVVHMFVGQMLNNNIRNLKSDIKQQLMRIYTKDTFDDDDARLLEGLIRYAAVEGIRDNVKRIVNGASYSQVAQEARLVNIPLEQLIRIRVGQAEMGITAGRSPGACGLRLRLSEDDNNNPFADKLADPSSQEAYGGKGNEGEQKSDDEKTKWKWTKGLCRISNCPTRPKTTMVGPCAVCYGCQKKFDVGLDPTTEYARQQKPTQQSKPPAKQTNQKSKYELAA